MSQEIVQQTAAPAGRPALRLLAVLALFLPVYLVAAALSAGTAGTPLPALVVGVACAALALVAYRLLARRIERRPVTELDGARPGRVARWVLLGAGTFTAVVALVALLGGVERIGSGSIGGLVASVGVMAFAATGEEILFRAILFRLLEDLLGSRAALVLSAVLFGALHLLNPHATLWGAVAVAIEGGLMLAAVWVATRSLWPAIGVHLGWNLAQGGVLGATVSGSGSGTGGLLSTAFDGPALLTGGSFGPEASLVAVLVSLVPTVFFLRQAARDGLLLPRRSRRALAG